MSSIFGFGSIAGVNSNVVTLDTDQEVTGAKRMRNIDNELDCADLTCNNSAVFTGEVEFIDEFSPPHCALYPVNGNDLCNKAYVDAIGLLPTERKNLFLNISQSFSGYYLLSGTTVIADQNRVTTVIASGVNRVVSEFGNSFAALNLSTTIPAGVWSITLYGYVYNEADAGHLTFSFNVIILDTVGSLPAIYLITSGNTSFVNAVSPAVGTYTTSVIVPQTDCTGYDRILLVVTVSNTRNTSVQVVNKYQFSSTYAYMTTSYSVSTNLLANDNTWTGLNTFSQYISAAGGVRGSDSGSSGTTLLNPSNNSGGLSINNQNATGIVMRAFGAGQFIQFQTGATTPLERLVIGDTAVQLSYSTPILQSSSTGNPFVLRGGSNQGITLQTNNGTVSALTLSTSGVVTTSTNFISGGTVTSTSTFQGQSTGSNGVNLTNQSGNTGGLVLLNSNVDSPIVLRNLSNQGIYFQTGATSGTRVFITDSFTYFYQPVVLENVNPLIVCTSTTTDLVIKSGVGRGISLQPNNSSATAMTLAIDGTGTFAGPVVSQGGYRGLPAGSAGSIFTNTASNSGGVELSNQNTASYMTIRQYGDNRGILFQTGTTPVTRLNLEDTTATFSGNITMNGTQFQGRDSGSSGTGFYNPANNSGGCVLANLNPSGVYIRASGTGQIISLQTQANVERVQVNDSSLLLSYTAPILRSSSTTNPLVIRSGVGQGLTFQTNNATDALTIDQSGGTTTFAGTITQPFNGILNGGQYLNLRTTGTDSYISTINAGTNLNLTTATGAGAIKIQPQGVQAVNIGPGGATTFYKQIVLTPGANITATVTLATPLNNVYFMSTVGTTPATITLPNAISAYSGTRILFRRTSGGAGVFTFRTVTGVLDMGAATTLTLGNTVTVSGTQMMTELLCDGAAWWQIIIV